MNRQDLIDFSQSELRRQSRWGARLAGFFIVWMLGLLLIPATGLDRLESVWLFLAILVPYIFLPIIALIVLVRRMTQRIPRCPHCGIRLARFLLPIAVATGNCGHCGRSVES
jgi:hypothetical protein